MKKFRSASKEFIEVPFKDDPDAIKDAFDLFDDDGFPVPSQDEYGREIIDPRPMVVEVEELSLEQKKFNQLVLAHNKAVIEKTNLATSFGWDFSTPEKAKASLAEMLNLDMPDEQAEMFSAYEFVDLAQDYPTLPDPEPQPVNSTGKRADDPTVDAPPAPAPAPENPA